MTAPQRTKGELVTGSHRLVAGLCAIVAFGWVVYLAARFPAAVARGVGGVVSLLVYLSLPALACIDFVRHVRGRQPLGPTRDVWLQWVGVNALWIVLMHWETRSGQIGAVVALGSIVLGFYGRTLERRARAAEHAITLAGPENAKTPSRLWRRRERSFCGGGRLHQADPEPGSRAGPCASGTLAEACRTFAARSRS
jgi:hypothetical protein